MGVYRNIKCGDCKYSFTGGYTSDNGFMNTNLGIPFIECPKCGTINKTGWIPWAEFPTWKKFYHWTSIFIRGSVFGFGIGIIIYGIIEKWAELMLGIPIFIYVILGIAIMLTSMIRSDLKEIKLIKERCESNNWKTEQ